MTIIRKTAFILAIAVFTMTAAVSSYASEGGGNSYPNGAESIMAGAVPPPGFYFINYLNYYTADKIADNDGDAVPVDPEINVLVNVFRFVYTSPKKLLGGFLGAHTIIPVALDMDIEMMGMKDSNEGLGDITVGGLLSWHSKNWHFATALDLIVPTGKYDKNDLINPGRNYYMVEPAVGATYLSDNGIEASVKVMYDFNTENNDTDYKTGQEFHFDYFTGYHFAKSWVAGIGGYYYKQVTDDEVNGVDVENNKGQVFAYGPAIQYQYKNMSFIAKYQNETMVRNRSEGDKFWLKFIYAF